MSRRQLLTAGALAGATVLGTGLGAGKASAATPPATFYSPHQDDEALGLAGSILEHKAAGRPVYLVLVSRGENPNLATVMNTDPCPNVPAHPCAAGGHHGLNWPTDGASMIVPGRTSEFMASAAAIGVDKVINFQMSDSVWQGAEPFKQFTANVKLKIAALAAKYPGASHRFTAGWLETTATRRSPMRPCSCTARARSPTCASTTSTPTTSRSPPVRTARRTCSPSRRPT
ncbi:PIG-L deacetylase family protein [Kitasatospora sp. NPDC059648]|uniref:PIG-L deacetylase family protein n=1 Tax=Kitasatospora sp. NPDC059648 TaxID=3346894 RepID=UPI00368B1868